MRNPMKFKKRFQIIEVGSKPRLIGERDTLLGARRLANATRTDRPIIIEEGGLPVSRKNG
jgi:hypothetical protein